MLEGASIVSHASSDPLEAQACMSNSFCSHRLDVLNGGHVGFSHIGLKASGGAFNMLEYGNKVEVRSEGFDSFYMLEMPLQGGVDMSFGAEQISSAPGKALILSPGPRFRSQWHDHTRQWMLQIDRECVERRMTRLMRRSVSEMPVFNPVVDLGSNHGKSLFAMFRVMATALASHDGGEAADFDALTDRIIDLILCNVPFVRGGSIVPERLSATPRHIKRALELFHARFGERLSISTVCDEIGVSERALYEGFQRYYQKPPYEILTRIRMEEARRLILCENLSAAEAAHRVGLRHLGRFSAAYQATFGVLPSQEAKGRH